jgi:hypothetical protein
MEKGSSEHWVLEKTECGIAEVKLSSWKYFGQFIYEHLQAYNSLIWRGQRCENWSLEPTLDRIVKKQTDRSRDKFIQDHLNRFKFAAIGRRGANPTQISEDNDWWALGQHYGLATPLLDWTTAPFVAAVFAYVGEGEPQTEYRVVYALHKPTVEKWVERITKEDIDHREKLKNPEDSGEATGTLERSALTMEVTPDVQFIRPRLDENLRLVAQGGLFTLVHSGNPLQDWIKENHLPTTKDVCLMKILIPNKDRTSCLQNLNRMNINYLSLFPDLYGASMHSNLSSEISKY